MYLPLIVAWRIARTLTKLRQLHLPDGAERDRARAWIHTPSEPTEGASSYRAHRPAKFLAECSHRVAAQGCWREVHGGPRCGGAEFEREENGWGSCPSTAADEIELVR
eukprot:scaffold72200_cov31-Tisochrysis_lutea.AAC.4